MLVAGFVMLGAKLIQRFGALRVFRLAVVLFMATENDNASVKDERRRSMGLMRRTSFVAVFPAASNTTELTVSQLVVVLILLAAAIVMFAINRPRLDAVALIMLTALPFTGVLTMSEALAGFSDSISS